MSTSNVFPIIFKPIFHWKLCSRWLPNAGESDTNNMKSTWPTQEFCVGTQRDLYSTCSHWGFALGVTQILAFVLRVMQILVFLDTNMLVSPGGISNAKLSCWGYCPTRRPNASVFGVAVEYRPKYFVCYKLLNTIHNCCFSYYLLPDVGV